MTESPQTNADAPSVEQAAAVLRRGDLVAFPTETVYGLGADAANPEALAKIFALKGRPADHPLIVHIGADEQLEQWARDVSAIAHDLIARFWPGPLTLVLRKQPEVPDLITGKQDTVAVRMPGHPLALELLRAFDGGLAAPSANRFGRISPTTAEHVREEFGAHCPLVLEGGPCEVGLESTILSLAGNEPLMLRPGGITPEQLAEVLGQSPRMQGDAEPKPRVPGSIEAHYAPLTPLMALPSDRLWDEVAQANQPTGVLALGTAPETTNSHVQTIVLPSDPESYARGFYAALRSLDRAKLARLYVEAPPRDAAWLAVWNRLERAVHGSG